MELAELLTEARRLLDDNVVPPFWSDEEIVRHLNGAVDEAAIRTRVLQDSSSAAARLALRAGVAQYKLCPVVFVVRRIRIDGEREPLTLVDTVQMDERFPGWDDPSLQQSGVPTHAVFDFHTGYVRVYPVPAVAATARMLVWRRPNDSERLDANDTASEPALPDMMHRELAYWAAAQCLLNPDQETRNTTLAGEYMGLFEAAYGRKPDQHEIRLWSTNKRRHVRACYD
jgi:hypothetical protein